MAVSYGQLGVIAQDMGDHDKALNWHRQALAIFEALGHRASMSTACHQIGNVAVSRGDHAQALDWYRRSLALDEELGDRAGQASTMAQIGRVFTENRNSEDGLSWTLRSLRILAEFGLPQPLITIQCLQRQRSLLGGRRFYRLVRWNSATGERRSRAERKAAGSGGGRESNPPNTPTVDRDLAAQGRGRGADEGGHR